MRIILLLDSTEYLCKVIKRHVRMKRRYLAITSAVAAFHIASERAFPEKLPERMLFCAVFNQLTLKLESNLLLEG
jgi:hypothetical protein